LRIFLFQRHGVVERVQVCCGWPDQDDEGADVVANLVETAGVISVVVSAKGAVGKTTQNPGA
jgi:hypothetical protein